MISIKNTQKTHPISVETIRAQAQSMLSYLGYDDFDLGIWFTTNKTIRDYNRRYRNKDKPTDILSFPFHELSPGERIVAHTPDDKNLGDIIISPAFVHADASNWGHTYEQRLPILLAHGIAHLLGYDHQTEAEFAEMQEIEHRLLDQVK